MPSGTMAQQIVLKIWSEKRGSPNIAFHPKCHLAIHEQKAYQKLHRLHGILVGSPDRLITLEDLNNVQEPLAALLLELPQREIGGQLPSWEDLNAQIEWARSKGIPIHLDGARLWDCQPYYQRSYAEIAALFDTVYVSFYKILAGISGAVLAGPRDIIAESRIWLRRHGGNLRSLYPYVLSAQMGMLEHLDQMSTYHHKAVEIATVLKDVPGIEIVPDPPQTVMMHLYLHGDIDRLEQAAIDIAQETGVFMFYALTPTQIPNVQKQELTVGNATLDISGAEIASLYRLLLEKAQA